MNEHDLDLTLGAIVSSRTQVIAPPILRAQVRAVPLEVPQQRSWLPRIPKWRFQSMFSATKFVVAGVIVALFGGFLVAGVLTTDQNEEPLPAVGASPSLSAEAEPTDEATTAPESAVTTDLLPGVDLVTEEVEPGVYRVKSDGVRELSSLYGDEHHLDFHLVAGQDGSVWHFWLDSFFRLGDDETQPWYGSPEGYPGDDFEVGPDGTVWWAGADGKQGLRSFDDQGWSVRREAPLWGAVRAVEIDPDGRVWTSWADDAAKEMSVARLDDDGWQTLRTWQQSNRYSYPWLSVGSAGDAWVMLGQPGDGYIWRLADGEREQLEPVDEPPVDFAGLHVSPAGLHVSTDGTVWAWMDPYGLARFDGSDWTLHGTNDGVPDLPTVSYSPTIVEAADDGSAWVASHGPDDEMCRGVTNFDGSVATTFLPGLCVEDVDVAPDGSVWLLARAQGSFYVQTYVITPEAVAATE